MDFDVIVIGAGHAGIEAGLAAARMGCSALLITMSLDSIGRMSCNPAIGGLSKGNIVREIDALGGEMGKLIDRSMIQFRILNRSRGPAVQAPRAQADKALYAALAKNCLERTKGLCIFQDTVTDIKTDGGRAEGVITQRGRVFTAKKIVLTTGTFMEASVFIGEFTTSSGRLGEPAAQGLGANLRRMGFPVGRLKTGTPARVRKSSLDFSRMEEQPGEDEIIPFSFSNDSAECAGLSCWITWTNEKTHAIIRGSLHRSPLYSGKITGIGPRYCPSIEDKVVRFAERRRHQVFVEPEGPATEEMYLNGISSSLPEDVQEAFLRTLCGLENVQIMRPGYAVEYDYINPTALYPSLETKLISGLYVAGQTNGTSGYEEAAGQGLVAGLNAALAVRGEPPLILSRAEAYIGVLIDDLVTLGTKEPYRMFTSRAEYRLGLRHDTADRRLLPKAYACGLQSEEAMERLRRKTETCDAIKELLRSRRLAAADSADAAGRALPEKITRHTGETLYQTLKDPEVSLAELEALVPALSGKPPALRSLCELDIKYEGYIKRQEREVERFKKMENVKIPPDFDWDGAEGLSSEARQKLKTIRPLSVGQASRVAGVRPSDIAVLSLHLRRKT
ncbi:MAG: tRNA uridine-5-carboxymethylaminomethyl(34) synthesis enzyme MnmG [Spirochaetales bacterium]|jgi:tRNA uridine 5-carboxymethylaminomethyl modification enzyme|nr:tRNA uridine-5-carboxymethylaminomethyl(34) synthesis enzyme MnmG [Spirochaetales bacterium]